MARVFVSYRRVAPDNGIAMALYRRLSDRGHDVFLDSERVHLGDRWPRTIREALDRAEWFVVIRDEYRTPLEAVFPGLAARARNFALLPLEPADAARALAAILDSAGVAYDRAATDLLVHELVDGAPPRVRPARLQLIAHEARESGERLDAHARGGMATSRRAFFERHIRTTVLDLLGASIARIDAARSLRGLTAGELKAAPRTIDEVAADEEIPVELVRRVLDLASAPHARVASVDLHGELERFELVHDLFAAAIHGLVKEEEARQREEEARRREAEARRRSRVARRVAQVLGSLFVVAIVSAGVAAMMWRRADQARAAVQRQERRETASKLAVMAERSASPSGALALAAEAIDATGSDGVTSDVMRAAYGALGMTHGPALPGSQGNASGIAVSSDGALAAVADEGGVRVWTLTRPAARPRHLEQADDLAMVPMVFDRANTHLFARTTLGLWSWDLREPAPQPVRLAWLDQGAGMPMDDRVVRSADGTWLVALSVASDAAAGSSTAQEVRAWNLAAHSFDPGVAPIAVPLARADRIVSSPTAAWIAVKGPDGIASIELRSRSVRITAVGQLLAAIARSAGGDSHETSIELLAISDHGALIMRWGGRPRSVSIVTLAPGDLLRATVIELPDAPNGSAAWHLRKAHPSLLFVGVGVVRPSRSDTRICALPFEDRETSVAAPDGEVTCSPMAGYPMVARGDWLVTSEVLASIASDGSVTTRLPVAFQRGAVRDHGVPLYATIDLDAAGRTAVVWTPDAVVVWPSTDDVADGRAWSGALPVAGPPRGDRSGSHGAPRCEVVPSSDLVAASEDGQWEVVSRRDPSGRGDSESRLELWSRAGSPRRLVALGVDGRALARFDADARCLVLWVEHRWFQLWSRSGDGWRGADVEAAAEAATPAFSPDRRWLALGGQAAHVDGGFGVVLVPLADGCVAGRPQHLAGPHLANPVTAIVFRSDSRQLAMVTTSGGETGGPVLATWDLDAFHTGGEPSLIVDEVGTGDNLALVYEADLLYAVDPGGARLGVWPVTASAIREQARRHAGRNLGRAEWRAAFGERPYRTTFPELTESSERIEQAVDDARIAPGVGQRFEAAAGYQIAVVRALDRDVPSSLQWVCSCGVHDGWASVVAPACDRMIQLEPQLAPFVKTYALAQAHAGQPGRALEWLHRLARMQVARVYGDDEKARGWIAQLEHGELPELPDCPP